MTYLETSLFLVNRGLRQAGQREAYEREEPRILALASLGHGIEWIGAQVLATRITDTIACHGVRSTDTILGA